MDALDPDTFPVPLGLEPQVAFWRNVYSVWGRSEVAIHDDRHLDVVYEVLEFPESGEGLDPDQKDWIASRLDYWRDRLFALEDKLASGAALDGDDRQIASLLAGEGRDFRDVATGAGDRVRSQRGMRERFLRGLEIAVGYEPSFRTHALHFGLF